MKLKAYLLFQIFIFLTIYSFAQENSFHLDNSGTRIFHDGKLFIKEGVPFLSVKGDAYEMGLQYGVLMNDLLIDMDNVVDSLIESYIGGSFIKRWVAGIVLNSKIKKVEKMMPFEYIEELEGMAKGCDLRLKDLQIIAYFPQLFFKISCTSFIMKNNTGLVHGRNLDWPGIEALTHHPLVVTYNKTNKIPVTVLTFVGYPGVYTGMNFSGLSMSINMNGTPAETDKEISDYNTGMPLAFKLRNILENTDNLKGVDNQFKDYSSHAWFITVGSKSDNSGAIYELTRGEIIKNTMHDDFIFVENLSLSDRGRYQYSPIWMFGPSNISREKKIQELYTNINDEDLISKSYQILTNTENYHLSHDPFYRYSINNSMTVKSCIMDNINNEIYFTYNERLAALNKYLKYEPKSGEISVYRQEQKIPDQSYLNERIKYLDWYKTNYSTKRKLNEEDYINITNHIDTLELEPAYKAYLLSYYYLKLENNELAYKYSEEYISEKPDYYHSYYNKFQIMSEQGKHLDAVVALEEMLQTSTITPYYEYLADFNMIKMYDKILEQDFSQIYIDKINKLARKIKSDLNQYFIDKKTQEDLNMINDIQNKYRN